MKALGTKKAGATKVKVDGENIQVFYNKETKKKFAVVGTGLYEPDCTHTWVIALNDKVEVTEIRVVEMKCPHAFPTKKASFLNQYKGKGIKDVGKLDSQISTVAKATGSAVLTTKAVKKAIKAVQAAKSKI